MDPPDAVKAATATYKAESDPVGDFLAQRTTAKPLVGKSVARVMAKELLDAYTGWAQANGQETLSSKALGDAMTSNGRAVRKPFGGHISYVGLRLLTPEERAAADGGDGDDGEDDSR